MAGRAQGLQVVECVVDAGCDVVDVCRGCSAGLAGVLVPPEDDSAAGVPVCRE